jgi:hypothetical protein
MQPGNPLGPYAVLLPVLILLPILYFRMRRMAKLRPLKLNQLWIRPALIVVIALLAIFSPTQPGQAPLPPLTPEQWAWLGLAVLLGGVGGWHYGRTIAIEVHPENGTLMTKGSVAAMLVIVVLVLVRMGLRPFLAMQGGGLHLDVRVIADASIVFTAALFAVRSLEMYLRAKRVMAESGRTA